MTKPHPFAAVNPPHVIFKPDDMLRVPSLAKRDFDRMQLQYAVYAW